MINKITFWFVVFSVIASVLNYIIYPILSRILPAGDYINITVSLSLFTQISTFLSSIIAITIGLSKSDPETGHGSQIEKLQVFLFKIFLVLAAIFLILSPVIMRSIHTPVLFAAPIVLMMLFSIPILIISGYLNGKNRLVSMGIVTLIAATSQFVIGLLAAMVTRDGLLTLFSVSLSQILTIALIYALFSNHKLPSISRSLAGHNHTTPDKRLKRLLVFTGFSAISIMLISLIQVVDLFIIQRSGGENVKFYTDIYVVSRAVFFAGTIFIWPFLGLIDINDKLSNRKPFIKMVCIFIAISMMMILMLYFFGDKLVSQMFGAEYDLDLLRTVGSLSILYKYNLLVITGVALYFVVLRNYVVVWISLLLSLVIFVSSQLLSGSNDMSTVLLILNLIVGPAALICTLLLFYTPTRSSVGSS